MKTMIRPIAMAMVLVIAGSSVMKAQRGMGRMMHDSTHMRMMMHDTAFMKKEGFPMMHMRHMNAPMYSQMCPGCGMGMGPGARGGMRPGMGWGPGAGRGMRPDMGWGPPQDFRGGMGRGQFGRPGLDGKPGIGRLENIPNLTDKQKKDIADLRQKQMDEMKKLREDQRKKVLNLLTDEQKKFIEGNTPAPAADIKKPLK